MAFIASFPLADYGQLTNESDSDPEIDSYGDRVAVVFTQLLSMIPK